MQTGVGRSLVVGPLASSAEASRSGDDEAAAFFSDSRSQQSQLSSMTGDAREIHCQSNEDTVSTTRSSKIALRMRGACLDYQMLEEGDHIMVCVSAGKDSATLLHLLTLMQEKLSTFTFV